VDLRAFVGAAVAIWSEDADLWFCFAATDADTTLITSGDRAASDAALVASAARKGLPEVRIVEPSYPWLIAAHMAGSGTVRVKPVLRAQ
jgi:hypothetical protein